MNIIKYDNTRGEFPLSTQALNFNQDMIKMAYELARLGGGTYILRGCVNTTGNTWSDGMVVINGELLPFSGGTGTTSSTVRIKEVKTDIVAGYETYEGSYTNRYVEFGSNIGNTDTYNWSDFKQVKSLTEIVAEFATKEELTALSNLLKPVGDITMFGSSTNIPSGHMLCNGQSLSRDQYASLFAVIGTTFGSASETTFNLPDLRARFIVGYDERMSNTPPNVVDGKEINYGKIGNTGGKPSVLLSAAQSGIRSHFHWLFKNIILTANNYLRDNPTKVAPTDGNGSYGDNNNKYAIQALDGEPDAGKSSTTAAQEASESHENRPPYYVLSYIIKVV